MEDTVRLQPRLIIHGGAGNISRQTLTPERRRAYRAALTEIITRTRAYMTTPAEKEGDGAGGTLPSALATATFAVVLLEDDPLFNSGRGAVFTRDGVHELEASVMVSRGRAKRGVGVMGLRRVRNPVLLARRMLEHGDADLAPHARGGGDIHVDAGGDINVDAGAQGHTQVFGAAAEALAVRYGLPLVDPAYFFTQARWDEHVRGLERERAGSGRATASWAADAYLPQGTCGAVALDGDGVVCCATSTGGLTNKLTGRVGDTPVVGAGAWAGAWTEAGDPTGGGPGPGPAVDLSGPLRRLLADCLALPPALGLPLPPTATTTRAVALSGTGNGDSFLRVSAAHAVAAMAQYRPLPFAAALAAVAGPGGVLQASAGARWGRTGEGEGGMIGIESVVVRSGAGGRVRGVRSTVVADCNCGGMFRAWVDDAGRVQVRIFRDEDGG